MIVDVSYESRGDAIHLNAITKRTFNVRRILAPLGVGSMHRTDIMTSKLVQLGFIGDLGIPGRLRLVACLSKNAAREKKKRERNETHNKSQVSQI